jgi:cob(I)alamin adenosyltransferase
MSEPPIERPPVPHERKPSLVLVATGDGKGKSTAAFGTMLRALARGWNVAVVQFLKSGEWKVGEEKIGRQLGVRWLAAGDGFTWDASDLDESEAVAQAAWSAAAEVIASGEFELVILDEITYPMTWGWIDTGGVVAAIRSRPEKVNVFATGRDAPAALVEMADTVTEMREIKHAFASGVPAKKGLDY